MRRTNLVLALAVLPQLLTAQRGDTVRSLPREVAHTAAEVFNVTAALRGAGPTVIEAGREIRGDVAVLDGPLTIAGHVTGRVVAINADVILAASARIDGDVLVIGGELQGRDHAELRGDVRVYRQRLQYVRESDRIVVEAAGDSASTWWRPWAPPSSSGSKLQVASAGAYNRVEGLPINLGPQLYRNGDSTSVRLDAYAVVRTGSSFQAHDNDIGHNIRGEVRLGHGSGLLIGGRVYDVVEPVASWELSNLEAGLAAGLFRHDYRDYYQRHGASAKIGMFSEQNASMTLSYAGERWMSRETQNPWTLFNNSAAWRPNPAMDDAHMHLLNTTLKYDSRTNESNPWSGWYLLADYERGIGHIDSIAPTTIGLPTTGGRRADYGRAFFDLRRYNRVSRWAQLNMRIVAGGWTDGDPLPLERRMSVDGPGALSGYPFRTSYPGGDISTCTVGAAAAGFPAQCDRMALGQIEYRSTLHFDLLGWAEDRWGGPRISGDGAWVLFADAGRGWLVGDGSLPMAYGRDELPPISSFRTDMGLGLDFSEVGVFAAKALSTPGQPVRVFVRLRHRF